jgi:hypothetical protein
MLDTICIGVNFIMDSCGQSKTIAGGLGMGPLRDKRRVEVERGGRGRKQGRNVRWVSGEAVLARSEQSEVARPPGPGTSLWERETRGGGRERRRRLEPSGGRS